MRPKCSRSGNTSACSGRNAPPESTRYTHGSRFCSAISCARRCFFTVIGIVRAALDRGVVGDDQHFAARHAADAGDEARARRVVVVQIPGGQRRQLQKRRSWVEQLLDPLAHRELALLAVPLDVLRPAALARPRLAVAELGDERGHPLVVLPEFWRGRVDARRESGASGRRHCDLPAAAVGLVSAARTAPDRVHAEHVGAAALAHDAIRVRRRPGTAWGRRGTGNGAGPIG